jgi:hypothetical protein
MVGGSGHAPRGVIDDDLRELMSAISHNLRTPLAVIKGCTDMLLAHDDDRQQLDDDRRRELLAAAAANVDRLADAIAWLEKRIDELAKGGTIRLPDEPTPGSGDPRP